MNGCTQRERERGERESWHSRHNAYKKCVACDFSDNRVWLSLVRLLL